MAQSKGLPETRVTRVHDTRFTTLANHRAAFIRFSALLYGKPYECLGLYAIMPVDQTQAILYSSSALAPASVFRKSLPGMWAAWMSWGIKDAVLRERLMSAVLSMQGPVPHSPVVVLLALLVSTGVAVLVSTVVAPDGATSAYPAASLPGVAALKPLTLSRVSVIWFGSALAPVM